PPPRQPRRRVLRETMARELEAAVGLVAHASEHRELERSAEAFAGVRLEVRIAILFSQEPGDFREARDRVDVVLRRRAITAARKRLELGTDLRGEAPEQRELLDR